MIGARDAGAERLGIDPGQSSRRKPGPMCRRHQERSQKSGVFWQGCRMNKCKNANRFWLLQLVGKVDTLIPRTVKSHAALQARSGRICYQITLVSNHRRE